MEEQFKAYRTSRQPDGKITIHDVEIFELGSHKGFDYSPEWAQKALENHAHLQNGGFYPSAIIGHNDGKEEKPARGRMANFRMDGKYIKADLTHVPEPVYESLKQGEYPHRSVEVNPQEARFTALALLGGTSPYHKLPNLELFGGDPEAVRIPFRSDDSSTLQTITQEIISKIKSIFENKQEGKKMPENNTQQMTEAQVLQKHAELFKQQFGMTPEEAVAALKQERETQAQAAQAARQAANAAFAEKLKKEYHLAPAFVDERIAPFLNALAGDGVVKFSESEQIPQAEAFRAVITGFLDSLKEEKLFLPGEETVTGVKYEQFEGGEDTRKLHEKISKRARALVAEGKFKGFAEAYQAAAFEEAGK